MANKSNPVGAGANRFVKFENEWSIILRIDLYYKVVPQVAFLQLKDMTDTTERDKKHCRRK